MSPDQIMRDSKHFSDLAYFVLEEVAKRLDNAFKLNVIRHFNHIMVSFDNCGTSVTGSISFTGFNTVGVNSSLGEEAVCALFTNLVPENIIEFSTDNFTFLFRIAYSLESGEEFIFTIDTDKIHVKEFCKGFFNEIALVLTHKSLIDENAGKLFADCTAKKSGSDR